MEEIKEDREELELGMKGLLGKTITAVDRGFEGHRTEYLRFTTSGGGLLHYELFADCCSESFVTAIQGLDRLIGQKVKQVNDVIAADRLEGTKQESDVLYRITLATEKGFCDIEFRNSSNGYYGGGLDAVSGTQARNVAWTPVTADFSN